MARVITYGGDTKIGAYMFRDRKKPCICVQKGNQITIYGIFNSVESADNFMNELADFLGAKAGEQELVNVIIACIKIFANMKRK